MPTPVPTYVRLEPYPRESSLQEGFAAAVQDPVWFLARQWQMGELQGENASSPVWVEYGSTSRDIAAADPRFDPTIIPAESIVESELDDWWTMGRRVRVGRRVGQHPAVTGQPGLAFASPAPPYEYFAGAPDGLAIWRQRAALQVPDAAFGVDVPADSTPAWDPEHLLYQQSPATAFRADATPLVVQRHRGGRLDWHSVDADTADPPGPGDPESHEAIPTPFGYPGAPAGRWWQIEDAEVDVGGYAPDSAHTPTAMLTELIFSHGDDWFLFPVAGRAGRVLTIESMSVTDAFGRTYATTDVDPGGFRWPGLQPPDDWTLFKVDGATVADGGLAPAELVLWHVAELPLEGLALERVQLGLDEQSDLLWAVERTVDGREVESRPAELPDSPLFNEGSPTGDARQAREYAYVPSRGVVAHWHPYTLNDDDGPRRLVQRSLADLSRQQPDPDAPTDRSGPAGAHRGRPAPDRAARRAQQRDRGRTTLDARPRHARPSRAVGPAAAAHPPVPARPPAQLRRAGGGPPAGSHPSALTIRATPPDRTVPCTSASIV